MNRNDSIGVRMRDLRLKKSNGTDEMLGQSQEHTTEFQGGRIKAYELMTALKEKCRENGGVLDLLG